MLPIVLLACAGAALALPTNLTLEYPFPSLQATPTRRRHAYRQEASASLSASASSFSHPPTASQLGMSPKDALKLAYGFDPAYDLDAVEPYDRDEVISLQAWKDRDMQSFTRFYFDSFYDSSSTYDTVQQFLMSPEIDWPNGQCDIASDWSHCGEKAWDTIYDGSGRLTNYELNVQILFWNIGNLNNAFHTMDTALSMSKWDAGGGLQTLLDNLLPDKDPAAKSSSMWLDVISLLLLVVPELAIPEMIAASVAEKAVAEAVQVAEKTEQAAAKELETALQEAQTAARAAGSKWSAAGKSGSIPKSKFFQDSITRAAKDKYGSILQGLAKNVKDATKTAEENAEELAGQMESVIKHAETWKKIISETNGIIDEVNAEPDDTATEASDKTGVISAAKGEVAQYQANVRYMYTQARTVDPYASGSILDLILPGTFAPLIDDNEVNNMEDQFNDYLQAWTINEVFGNQGRKVVLYKQQWNSLADCQAVSSRWYNNQFPGELVVPGFKCFQCSKDLPEDVVTNNCKDGFYYSFFPSGMTRSAKSQLFRTPPNGNLGHSFNGPSDPNEVLVPGMNNLDALGEMFVNGRTAEGWRNWDVKKLYWNSWKVSMAAQANGWDQTHLWPEPTEASVAAGPDQSFVMPVLDVNDGATVTACRNWASWSSFGQTPGSADCGGNLNLMWFWFFAQISTTANPQMNTMDDYAGYWANHNKIISDIYEDAGDWQYSESDWDKYFIDVDLE